MLDFVRRDPSRSADVLQGLLLGRTAPIPKERKQIENPALIIGHPSDPLHPFSDADMVARELPNAARGGQLDPEWRISPTRLDAELAAFLDEVWSGAKKPRKAAKAKRSARRRQLEAEFQSRSDSKPKSSAKPRRKSGQPPARRSSRESGLEVPGV